LQVLEAYCNWLENRVVARFDAAVAEGNLRLQAQSVSIMIELDKERSIAQVRTSTRVVPACSVPCSMQALHLLQAYDLCRNCKQSPNYSTEAC
jgi:hypothetical protein